MSDDEDRLRRIDENLDLSKDYMREGHELMARIDASMARLDATIERLYATIDRNTDAFLGMRAYLDGATRMLSRMAAEIGADREERIGARQEQRELWAEWREERKDWREESRRYREALAARLDRLRNEPPPAAA